MRRRTRREAWEAQTERRGPDECWPWRGGRDRHGYGICKAEGTVFGAHRVAFEVGNGHPPVGVVRHTCDTTWCQNFGHLLDGTQQQNVNDREQRRRGVRPLGEQHGLSKLTTAGVRAARDAHAGGESFSSIARRMGVSRQVLTRAIKGETWRHL